MPARPANLSESSEREETTIRQNHEACGGHVGLLSAAPPTDQSNLTTPSRGLRSSATFRPARRTLVVVNGKKALHKAAVESQAHRSGQMQAFHGWRYTGTEKITDPRAINRTARTAPPQTAHIAHSTEWQWAVSVEQPVPVGLHGTAPPACLNTPAPPDEFFEIDEAKRRIARGIVGYSLSAFLSSATLSATCDWTVATTCFSSWPSKWSFTEADTAKADGQESETKSNDKSMERWKASRCVSPCSTT